MDSANITGSSLASAAEITKSNLNGILEQAAHIIGIYDGRGRVTVELKRECDDCSSLSILFRKQMIILARVCEKLNGISINSVGLHSLPPDFAHDRCASQVKTSFRTADFKDCVPAGEKLCEERARQFFAGVTEALKPVL